ncbi:DNA adenine methylase [Laceyella sacchari]|uniref:DNA adenine methylase n=1 Tax=Laceyella sacchari TaxID=37482 RepID=A0ABY5U6M9_LACSH|nr:DNA adenine methylase [Laceyella sacchari]UWE05307.1 DNA adenine methylase [Laceyella sacchari]
MKTRSPLIWFGGKGRVANEIINRMPDHKVYVEPFGGAAHVLAQKSPVSNEVYNDIDGALVNFLLVARDKPDELASACSTLPYSRQLYEEWRDSPLPDDKFERAVRFFYLNRCGIQKGNGPKTYRTGWRHNSKPNQSPARSYQNACQLIQEFSRRMRYVQIEQDDFRTIIQKYDSPETLFYVDPPYFGREQYYAGGFTEQDHRDLANILANIEGKAIVSYYADPLLDELYAGWRIETFEANKQVVKHKGLGTKTEELLIMNFDLQMTLFDWEVAR